MSLRHIPAGRSCWRNAPYWLFQLAAVIAIAASELRVCVFTWQKVAASNQMRISFLTGSPPSKLKLHYLLRNFWHQILHPSLHPPSPSVAKMKVGDMLGTPASSV